MLDPLLSIHAGDRKSATSTGVMFAWISIPFEFAATVLAADLLVGAVHWLEDAYVRESWPLVGRLVARPNILHHHLPRHFVRKSWLESCWDQMLLAGFVVGLAAWAGLLGWQVVLFAVLVGNANQIHKWAHRSRRENGPVIGLLQDLRILQGSRHHALHHTDPKSSHYCVITEHLNPILERLRFWTRIECALRRLFHLRRRADTSNRRHGAAPAWIREAARA
jgi:ubiquitin-conjugating enzyme E2 variant